MPCYYLDHPQHGAHICYTPEDVESHKLNGWIPRETKEKPATEVKVETPKKLGRPKKAK